MLMRVAALIVVVVSVVVVVVVGVVGVASQPGFGFGFGFDSPIMAMNNKFALRVMSMSLKHNMPAYINYTCTRRTLVERLEGKKVSPGVTLTSVETSLRPVCGSLSHNYEYKET